MNYKIVITGPVGSGKTTAVNSLSDRNAMMTDATVSNADKITKKRKKTTTVAMDYDVIRLDEHVVHVYGTPGQERFDFMWDILSQGAHGVILLLDNNRNYPFRDLKYYVNRFSKLIKSSRLILGITRFDIKSDPPIDAYKHWLKTLKLEADVVAIDAREKEDVTQLFYKLLEIPCAEEKLSIESEDEEDQTIISKEITDTEEKTKIEQVEEKPKSQFIEKEIVEEKSKEESKEEPVYEADDIIQFNETMLQEIEKLDGVTGVTLSSSMGELLQSTIKDEELNEFVAFLSGITPEIESTLNRGKMNRIMLRSPCDENLTIFVEQEKSLGVSSSRRKSVQMLSQQVEDMLQWM